MLYILKIIYDKKKLIYIIFFYFKKKYYTQIHIDYQISQKKAFNDLKEYSIINKDKKVIITMGILW